MMPDSTEALAVKFTVWPAQAGLGAAVTPLTVGLALTVMVLLAVPVQLFASVTVTV